jgi:SAM-dependent methyltransferase
MQNRMGMNRTREFYERHPFGHFSYGEARDAYNRPLVDFLKAVEPDARVFDVGCGTGYWMEAALRFGVRADQITGMDLAVSGAARMRSGGFNVVAASAGALPLMDDIADVIICNGVIHHSPAPYQLFEELVRIAKPGGRIFLGVYSWWNPYFCLVHRAAWPIRYIYWNWTERVLDWIGPLARRAIKAAARLATGVKLSDETANTLLMDQLCTPEVHLFSKRRLQQYASRCNCEMTQCRLTKGALMWGAVFSVHGNAPGHAASVSAASAHERCGR